jgi:hypothetical protein
MNSPVTQFQEIHIDGQIITIPTLDEWISLMRNPVYLDSPVYSSGTQKLVNGLLSFTAKHRDKFCLGMYRVKGMKLWFALPLFRIGDGWQRVQIEHLTCDKCGWRGVIANPTEPSLYFGVPNELEVTRRTLMLPRLGCLKCGAPLPRLAVWAESVNGVSSNA